MDESTAHKEKEKNTNRMASIRLLLCSLLLFFLPVRPEVVTSINSNYGCLVPTNSLSSGFDAKLYAYPWAAGYYLTKSYYYSVYWKAQTSRHATGIQGVPSFDYDGSYTTTTSLWGMRFLPSNFLVEFTMYLYAPYTGFYTFYFHNVDDGCMAFLGNGAFACCNSDDVSGGNDGNALLYANYNVDTGPTGNTAQVYLEGNIFYPLKIVYINVGNVGTFGFGIQDSNNQNLALQNYLFRLPGSVSEGQCTQASLELPKTSTTEICFNCQRPSTTTYITYISQSSLTYPVPQEVIEVSAPPQTTIRSTVACLTCTATYSFTTGGFVTSGTTSIRKNNIRFSSSVHYYHHRSMYHMYRPCHLDHRDRDHHRHST